MTPDQERLLIKQVQDIQVQASDNLRNLLALTARVEDVEERIKLLTASGQKGQHA